MITVKVLLDSAEKVKRFSAALSTENDECELIEGVHIIDAKSIMGIFSLDLKKAVQLNIHSDDKEILSKLKEFIVEE